MAEDVIVEGPHKLALVIVRSRQKFLRGPGRDFEMFANDKITGLGIIGLIIGMSKGYPFQPGDIIDPVVSEEELTLHGETFILETCFSARLDEFVVGKVLIVISHTGSHEERGMLGIIHIRFGITVLAED